jgi:hypothetical protein
LIDQKHGYQYRPLGSTHRLGLSPEDEAPAGQLK